MAENIDSLQIEISADAVKAVKALGDLEKKIKSLSSVIENFSSKSLKNFASNIKAISDLKISDMSKAVKRLNKLNDLDFSKVANEIESVNGIDFSGFNNFANAYSEFAGIISKSEKVNASIIKTISSVAQLATASSGMETAASQLPELGRKLNEFITDLSTAPNVGNGTASLVSSLSGIAGAGTKAQKMVTVMPQLTGAIKTFILEMSKAPKVNNSVVRTLESLSRLAPVGAKAGTAANRLKTNISGLSASFSGLNVSTNFSIGGIKNFTKGITSLFAKVGGIAAIFTALKESINISSDLTEAQNVVDTVFGDSAQKINEFSKSALQNFGVSELAAKQTAGRYQAMGTAMGIPIDTMTDMSMQLTKLSGDLASFYNVSQKETASKLQAIFSGESEPLRDYGADLTQATVEAWALSQGIDADMQSMSRAEQAMLRYQYVLSVTGAAQDDFLYTSGSYANQIRLLTESFKTLGGIVGGVLINAFKPFIQTLNSVMGSVINFAQVVSDALGAIFGWKYDAGAAGTASDMANAASSAEDLEAATGGAADNAKKLKSYTLGIDELNILDSSEQGNSGGGGAGSGGAATPSGGQWTRADSDLKEYISDIGSLYELGEYISDTLTKAMKGIDWDSIYQSASNFGSGLASFLNGLISPELFGAVGTTIAGALNTALYALNSFGYEFDWKGFGESIAAGINNFFSTFEFGLLADTINVFALGILNTIITGITQTDWKQIGEQIGIFLAEIDFLEIGSKVGEALWSAINAGIDVWKSMFSAAPIETTILTAVVGFSAFTPIVSSLTSVFGAITGILSNVSAAFSVFTGFLTAASTPVLVAVGAFTTLAAGLAYVYATNEQVRESMQNAIQTIQEALQPALEFISNKIIPDLQEGFKAFIKILEPFGEFLENTFTSIWEDMLIPVFEYAGNTVIPLLTETLENLWNKVFVPLGEFIESVFSPIIEALSKVLTTLWKNVVVPLADFIGGVFSSTFELVVTLFNTIVIPCVQGMIDKFNFLWNSVFVPIAAYLAEKFGPIFETTFQTIGDIITKAKEIFQGLIDFVNDVFKGDWESAWNSVKDVFKGVFNGIVDIAEGCINFVIRGINKLLSGLDDVADAVGDVIGLDIDIPKLNEIELPRFRKGGFPEEDGLFMANSTEIVGKFSNGKTAVANNEQIVAGIAQGVASAIGSVFDGLSVNMATPIPVLAGVSEEYGYSRYFATDQSNSYAPNSFSDNAVKDILVNEVIPLIRAQANARDDLLQSLVDKDTNTYLDSRRVNSLLNKQRKRSGFNIQKNDGPIHTQKATEKNRY